MPNPIKAVGGGIQGVRNASNVIKLNNKIVKSGEATKPTVGQPLVKKSLGVTGVANAFSAGVRNPSGMKDMKDELKRMKGPKKPGAK